jgi:hypothetical protein
MTGLQENCRHGAACYGPATTILPEEEMFAADSLQVQQSVFCS